MPRQMSTMSLEHMGGGHGVATPLRRYVSLWRKGKPENTPIQTGSSANRPLYVTDNWHCLQNVTDLRCLKFAPWICFYEGENTIDGSPPMNASNCGSGASR